MLVVHILNFRNSVVGEAYRWEREATTGPSSGKDHTEAQWITTTILLFDDCDTELSKCSGTSLAMTHITDGSATYREHYLSRTRVWSCFSNNHSNKTLFSTERGVTNELEPKSSFIHDSVDQPGHKIAQSTRGPGFISRTTRQLMSTGHTRTFITVIKLTDAQSKPDQIRTYGYTHCNELAFHT